MEESLGKDCGFCVEGEDMGFSGGLGSGADTELN